MNKEVYILCCDWGTSNLRMMLVRNSNLSVIYTLSGEGVGALSPKTDGDRLEYFRAYLRGLIGVISTKTQINCDGLPVMISGMASSSIGMVEVPYAMCPFNLAEPDVKYEKVERTSEMPHELYIIGGVRNAVDVMRGEEMQVLGLRPYLTEKPCYIILPGTHSKHVRVEDSVMVDFKTYMTGELFHLLSRKSILQGSTTEGDEMLEEGERWFKKGVLESAKEPLASVIFRVRTNVLLHGVDERANYHYLSGLLIGNELSGVRDVKENILVHGAERLVKSYEKAVRILAPKANLLMVDRRELVIPRAHVELYLKLSHEA